MGLTRTEEHLSPATAGFVFVIALKPKSASSDWPQAESNLRRTIRSALATHSGARVVVACHDEPDLGDVAEGVVLLRVPFPEPSSPADGGRDKAAKRRYAAAWLRETMRDGDTVYVMFLDADDLVNRALVDYVYSIGGPSYLVDTGYLADLERGLLRHRRTDFHKTCGSSFVCRFARAELPTSWDDLSAPFSQFGSSPDQRGHPEYDQVATELGRPPVQDLVPPRRARRVLREEFAAGDLADALSGYLGFGSAVVAAAKAQAQARVSRRQKPVWS
jgi:hypothetical protein